MYNHGFRQERSGSCAVVRRWREGSSYESREVTGTEELHETNRHCNLRINSMTTDFDEIPVIDFEQFLNGNMEEKIKTAKTIGEACRNVGFFYLKNHGVSKQLTEDAMAQSKRYFALPLDVKMKQAVRGQPYDDGRGYSPIFVENFSDKKGDFKEIFDFSLEMKEDDPLIKQGGKLYGPNRWPELPGFREVLYDGYFSAMIELARQLARAFALALDLPEKYFDSLTEKPLTETILIYYPPQKLDKPLDPNSVGKWKSKDESVVFILKKREFESVK
ncbi:hypothetical protein I4U23_000058 [Adineta vaga]|nr:hypothetical protein I4U23_000058 [Adineta vaga]